MRQPVLQLAFEYLHWPGHGPVIDPDVHLHLSCGADFESLQRAEESPEALASSFGLLATFKYEQVAAGCGAMFGQMFSLQVQPVSPIA
eukprot:Skav215408  [mRNA]  locus=scaffold356:34728:35183:- [translate_table: standard]